MKKQLKITFILTLSIFILTFCSKEESEIVDPMDPSTETLDPTLASSYLNIANSSIRTGNPPESTGSPSFQLFDLSYNAVPENGFQVLFKADDSFSGIYMQVVGTNTYFDISSETAFLQRVIKENDKAIQSRREENNYALPIGLDASPEVGQFCVEICVYDDQGNVSPVQQYCVTINNWGGNSNLVGKWKYVKIEEFMNGELVHVEEDLSDHIDTTDLYYHCSDSSVESAIVKSSEWIELSVNGDYSDNYLEEIISVDPNCGQEDIYDVFNGNWSYNATSNELSLVDFESIDDIYNFPNDPNYYVSYEGGDLYINGTVESLTSDKLLVKLGGTNSDGTWHELLYFEKF